MYPKDEEDLRSKREKIMGAVFNIRNLKLLLKMIRKSDYPSVFERKQSFKISFICTYVRQRPSTIG